MRIYKVKRIKCDLLECKHLQLRQKRATKREKNTPHAEIKNP